MLKWNPGPSSINNERKDKEKQFFSRGRLAICLIDFGRAKDMRLNEYVKSNSNYDSHHENSVHTNKNGEIDKGGKDIYENSQNQIETNNELNTKNKRENFSKSMQFDKNIRKQNYRCVSTNVENISTCNLSYDLPIIMDTLTDLLEEEGEKEKEINCTY